MKANHKFFKNGSYPKTFRSSCPEVFCKESVLRNFTKFTGKQLRQSLFFNKVVFCKVTQMCSVKKVFLEISQNSQENTSARVFFNKVASLRPATLSKKRDSGTDVFL